MGGAVILMAVLTGIYGCVWNGYFNKLIEFPFWRRGNWLMIALYAGILFFFLYTYGGFRIGYLKKGNLLCSQILSIGLLNIITYIQISLLDKKFHDPRTLLAMMLVQLLAAIVWTYLFQRLYRLLFPPRRMLRWSGISSDGNYQFARGQICPGESDSYPVRNGGDHPGSRSI